MDRKTKFKVCRMGFLKGFLSALAVTYLFYRNLAISCMISVIYGFYNVFRERKEYQKKQCYELTLEFREGLRGIAAALGAGYSMENAIGEARKDLVLLYGENSLLVSEFAKMDRQFDLNRPVEKVLVDFAGGDLISITRLAAEKISEKIEVRREIHTMIAGKKMESRIMNLIPLGMILYFWICSPGFLDCLYQSSGRFFMTVLLVLYVFAYWWSERVSDIKV